MKNRIAAVCMAAVMTGISAFLVSAQEADGHFKIGVPVYNLADEQTQAFREYLENYIGMVFEDVDFVYSQAIDSKEAELQFIQDCIDDGAKGIMAFNTFDLESEVSLCAENQVYYIRPAGTPAQADFELVKKNPYYLGYFGPGEEMEYRSGEEMAEWFAENGDGDAYFILSGGAAMGNVMHKDRTEGILDALQEAYQVKFDQSVQELAVSAEPVTVEKDGLKVTICSGYIAAEPFFETARETYEAEPAGNVLSVLPVEGMADVIGDAKLGAIDCYTAHNSELFNQGKMQYLCGKYSSIIGPAFAALYNAMTGYAEDFRPDGEAFAITQGFWTSDNREDFNNKYALSAGIALNAYSCKDIMHVIRVYNPEASLEDLITLGEQWDFESALQRIES